MRLHNHYEHCGREWVRDGSGDNDTCPTCGKSVPRYDQQSTLEDADLPPGTRVEIPAHYDLWMRGARYGVVKCVVADAVMVRMDHKRVRKAQRFPKADFLAYAKLTRHFD